MTRIATIVIALAFATAAQAQDSYFGNGSYFSNQGSGSPKIVAPNGQYLGNLNSNRYDPNSVSNPYGQYGSRYSPNSINNPYGQYGSPYSPNSVNNPYAQ